MNFVALALNAEKGSDTIMVVGIPNMPVHLLPSCPSPPYPQVPVEYLYMLGEKSWLKPLLTSAQHKVLRSKFHEQLAELRKRQGEEDYSGKRWREETCRRVLNDGLK